MAAPLHHLPSVTSRAAENMAMDCLLLENYPDGTSARFRHYAWSEPAFTFGFSQSWEHVRATAPIETTLIRRASGGGVVSHLDDWTYAVVLPFAHALCQAPARKSYQAIHQAIADVLGAQNVAATLQPCPTQDCATTPTAHKPGVCFVAPEVFDVIRVADGQKIAGAAQKRNRHGLLIQGSIAKAMVGAVDWKCFEKDFVAVLARVLRMPIAPASMPDFDKQLFRDTTARFASEAWNSRR